MGPHLGNPYLCHRKWKVKFTSLFLKFRELMVIKDINPHFHLAYEHSEISKAEMLIMAWLYY